MNCTKPVIALCCFAVDQYSETFIKAHRDYLAGNILTYYGGFLPCKLYPNGALPLGNKFLRFCRRLYGKAILKRELYDYQAALHQSLIENKVDVLFAEFGQAGVWCLDVCKDIGLPMVVHFHGADASDETVLSEYAERYPELFHYASSIVVVSAKMREDLINLGAVKNNIFVTKCAPNDAFFEVEPKFSEPLFIQVGRLIEIKAPLDTIRALGLVRDKHPEARLCICGDGNLLDECKKLIQELELSDNIELSGAVSPELIRGMMLQARGLVHPSVTIGRNRTEGGPVTVLEAMAAGLPVIGTRSGGIPDVIKHGDNGFLVAEHDIQAIATYMTELLENPGTARNMGKNGRRAAREKYSMENHINLLNNLIGKAMNE